MSIKEINIKTTDGTWWRLIVDDVFEIEYENDKTITDTILTKTSVPARVWSEDDDIDYLGKQTYINTTNIVAIKVVR